MKKTIYEIETIIDQIEHDAADNYDIESLGDCHDEEMKSIMCRMEKATTNVEFEKLVEEAEILADMIAKGIFESYIETAYLVEYGWNEHERRYMKKVVFTDEDEAIAANDQAFELYGDVNLYVLKFDTRSGELYDKSNFG